MIYKLVIGIIGLVVLAIGWLVIQLSWHSVFSEYLTDDDVLAGRSSCGNCGCTSVCIKKNQDIQSTTKIQ